MGRVGKGVLQQPTKIHLGSTNCFGPVLNHSANTKLVYAHHEQGRLFQFLIGLRDEFESARSHILHQDPLPAVSQAIHKLVDDETRL